ncbi:MAG: beta-lactamase family protein [Spirochaetaceae bacterium]|jgi:CubicO group peptidase (beta-lactamase class C family)|nr:beta-lactamase family protein [Spirochaetaceae bacterium]
MMRIEPYVDAVNRQSLKVEGILVLQHGEEIARYRWVPETPRPVYSVSKSFTSLAAGMAIDEGKLSLRTRVLDAFPGRVPEPSPRLSMLNLEHLLTMSRGHPAFSRPAGVDEALAQFLNTDPGARFVYDNGSTFLASAMVTAATGQKVRDFLLDRLFRPLGIPDPVWEESADGYSLGATGLELSTGSLARFGQLLLQRGNWQGKQLVSASWIDTASRAHITTKTFKDADYDLGYGYCFWNCRHGAYRADGKNGQYVVVLPREDAVAAISSDEETMLPILYAVWDHILPEL